jgi:hypothetical protein
METPIEIRYAGVVVARANEVRRMTVGGVDLFLSMPEPLPAGTVVTLSDGAKARIEKVIESSDPSVAGVYIKLLSDGADTQPWTPCFIEAEVPAPRPPAVVVSPVIVRPVHRTSTPSEVASRPEPIRVEAPPPPRRPEPVVAPRELTPEVMAVIAEPRPTVETIGEPPRPFTAPLPRSDEQIAHFQAEPPPAVVEGAVKRERSKRSTIVVAIPPPAEVADDTRTGVVKRAVGEIDTGSRRIQNAQAEVQSASIVVEPEPAAEAPEAQAVAHEPAAEEAKQQELRIEELSTARPLPPARGRATKRRKTTQR